MCFFDSHFSSFAFKDVKAFSGEDFEAKEWINKVFKQPEAAQNKEQFAQSLVMKLQLLIAKLNANLEEQSEQILQNLPKVVREIESLQQESTLLKSSMHSETLLSNILGCF